MSPRRPSLTASRRPFSIIASYFPNLSLMDSTLSESRYESNGLVLLGRWSGTANERLADSTGFFRPASRWANCSSSLVKNKGAVQILTMSSLKDSAWLLRSDVSVAKRRLTGSSDFSLIISAPMPSMKASTETTSAPVAAMALPAIRTIRTQASKMSMKAATARKPSRAQVSITLSCLSCLAVSLSRSVMLPDASKASVKSRITGSKAEAMVL